MFLFFLEFNMVLESFSKLCWHSRPTVWKIFFCKPFSQARFHCFSVIFFFFLIFHPVSPKKKCLPILHKPLEQILSYFLTILLVLRRWTSLTIPLGLLKSSYGLVGCATKPISRPLLNLFLDNIVNNR